MIYKINNIENDEFVTLILKELERNLKFIDDLEIDTVKESNNNKGIDFLSIMITAKHELENILPNINSDALNVTLGLVSATIYDIIKAVIMKYKRTKEYSDDKIIEIEITNSNGEIVSVIANLKNILEGENKK